MSNKGKGTEKYPIDEPKKGAGDTEAKGGKSDVADLDQGVGIPNKAGWSGNGAGEAESFVQDQAGGFGTPGAGSPGAGAITDRFGGGGDRTESANDLLNPDLPTGGRGGSPGTATWEDGPSDPSGGLTTGVGVADVSDTSDRRFDYQEAIAEYDKTDQSWDDYNSLHDKLDDIDDANPVQTSVDEFFNGERERATPPPPPTATDDGPVEQPLAALDETEIERLITGSAEAEVYYDTGEGSLVRDSPESGGPQSVAPDTAAGVYLEQDNEMSSETVIVAEDRGLVEYAVNQQSTEEEMTYGYDKNDDYFAVDGDNNAEPIARGDIPPGATVQDFDNVFEGQGNFEQPEKSDNSESSTDQNGADSSADDSSADDAGADDSADDSGDAEASDEQASDDGAEEGSDATTPSGEATGAELARQAEVLRNQGMGELVDRRDTSNDDVDPGDIDAVEGGGGQPTGDDGISNPEGTSAVSGTGRAPGDPGNIDYGEGDDRQYDGREQSPGEEVRVQHGSGLEGMASGDGGSGIDSLDPGDIDLGPPTVRDLDMPETATDTSGTADIPIEFGGGIETMPEGLISATEDGRTDDGDADYGAGDPAVEEAAQDDPVMSGDTEDSAVTDDSGVTEDSAENDFVDDYNEVPEQEEDPGDTAYEEEEAEAEEAEDVLMD